MGNRRLQRIKKTSAEGEGKERRRSSKARAVVVTLLVKLSPGQGHKKHADPNGGDLPSSVHDGKEKKPDIYRDLISKVAGGSAALGKKKRDVH